MTHDLFIVLLLSIATLIQASDQLTCSLDEDLVECPVECPSDYCPKHEQDNRKCKKPKICGNPECKCGFNMRRAENGTCIYTRDCPPFRCTAPNTEYVSCPSYCPRDDCSQATPDGRCPLLGYLKMTVECRRPK